MQNSKNPTIGIIDSGIGGVAVLKKLIKKFNAGNFIYLADNLNMPYGNKTKNWLKKRTLSLISFLKEKYHADYIIVACNTASTAIEDIKYKNIFTLSFRNDETYLATKLTKNNLTESKVIADKNLAVEIEKNIFNHKKLDIIVKRHVKFHDLYRAKRFVLACTHFELVEDLFKKHCPNSEIISNSLYLINDLNLKIQSNETNIIILETKANEKLREIFSHK